MRVSTLLEGPLSAWAKNLEAQVCNGFQPGMQGTSKLKACHTRCSLDMQSYYAPGLLIEQCFAFLLREVQGLVTSTRRRTLQSQATGAVQILIADYTCSFGYLHWWTRESVLSNLKSFCVIPRKLLLPLPKRLQRERLWTQQRHRPAIKPTRVDAPEHHIFNHPVRSL